MEIGGGIRRMETIDFYFDKGVSRVILGSAAINNPKLVEEAVKKYGDRIAVGIDANDGMVAAEGWTETSSVNYLDLGKRMDAIGVQISFSPIFRATARSPGRISRSSIILNRCRFVPRGGQRRREQPQGLL